MWEHGGCLESFQQNVISKCDEMDHHDIGTFENWASTESSGTILTNATPKDVQLDFVLHVGAECMCLGCT